MIVTPFLIVSFAAGLVFVIAGWILKNYPPKKINHWYGYRTHSSMASQERWDFAQGYSSKEMSRMGLLIMAIGLLGLFIPFSEPLGAIAAVTVMVILMIYSIYRVESTIKKKFKD